VWITIGIACLFFASYQAWLDEHSARHTAECHVRFYENARTERAKIISDKLHIMYLTDQTLMQEKVAQGSIGAFGTKVDDFINQSISWIRTNMGTLAAAKLIKPFRMP
jgi:hypothetical protein